MTRALLLAILAAAAARAAVIRGTVVENLTGKLLARAVVALIPMEGTPADVRTMRTTSLGGFEFDRLPAGAYIVKASRRGFIPAEYGQKRWNSAGQPVLIEESATAFLMMRLYRFSAAGGTVVDENDIGLPDHEVAVWKLTEPPELIRQATSDDRGVFRIGGLEPGRYVVRTMGGQYPEGGYLPTFSHETERLDQAQLVELFPEQQTDHADIRPLPGKLYSVAISAETDPPGLEVTITLASASGRRSVKAPYMLVPSLPPGDYEAYSDTANGVSGYQRFVVRDNTTITLLASPAAAVSVFGGPQNEGGQLLARRKDLAGAGEVRPVHLDGGRGNVPPGGWEFLSAPPAGFYASSFSPFIRGSYAHGWVPFFAQPRASLRISLSSGAGGVWGTVKDAPYAPVYLEAYDATARKRIGQLRTTYADARGQFRFDNLAPGTYRLLSTFEYRSPDTETIGLSPAESVTVTAKSDVVKDLELWIIR